MNKPDFGLMTSRELKRYLIAHRTDDDAWEAYLSRHKPSGKTYPPPLDLEGMQIMEQAFRERLRLPDRDQTT